MTTVGNKLYCMQQWKRVSKFIGLFLLGFLCHCCAKSQVTRDRVPTALESIYTDVQRTTFQYFWDGAEPNSGLARERFHADGVYPENDKNIVTTGGSGFGFMAILVGIKRGFITRQQGFERLQKMVNFLEKADRF